MKKKKEKNTGWGGGEEMHRQGTLGASGGKKEEGRKGNEGGVRGRMESWKEERRNQESIREKKEKRTSWTPLCSLSRSLSPRLCRLCATLFPPPPLQRTERARRESQSAGQSRGPKRKSNKTWSAFIICPPYIVCHRPAQTSGGRQKQPYACKHKCAPEKSSK